MLNNIFIGPNAVVAKQTISFATAGLSVGNCSNIYKVANPLQSWVPGRDVNPITGFVAGQGYYMNMIADMDLSAYVIPPVPTDSEDTSNLADLVAYWKLDETSGNRVDSYTHGFNLTPNGTIGSGSGKIGNAAVFTGTNGQRLAGPANNLLSINHTTGFCLSAWVKIPTGSLTGGRMIMSKVAPDGTQKEYMLYYNPNTADLTNGFFTFRIANADGTAWGAFIEQAYTPDGNWVFVFANWNPGDGNISVGINDGSVYQAGAGITNNFVNGTGIFSIGDYAMTTGPAPFTGSIDEAAVWSSIMLSGRVAALWNAGAGRTFPF